MRLSSLFVGTCLLALFTALRPAAGEPPTPPAVGSVAVSVVDAATATPLPDVGIKFRVNEREEQTTTDTGGRVTIPLPADRLQGVNVEASADGYVPIAVTWWSRGGERASVPATHTLRLERGSPIRGRVVDDAGAAVPGATVSLHVRKKLADPNERVAVVYESVKTDADGNWSYPTAPETFDAVSVGAYHHAYVTRAFYEMRDVENPASLRDGSHTIKLERGPFVEGVVTGSDGSPLRDARVGVGGDRVASNATPEIHTDADGRYRFAAKPGETVVVTVKAKDHAPELVQFTMPNERREQNVRLDPPATVAGVVVDPAGKPVPQAWVFVDTWRGHRTIDHRMQTDADGRFRWDEAPTDAVQADVDAQGYQRKQKVSLVPGQENRVEISRPTVVRGTVTDAETGQPVPAFHIVMGIDFKQAGQPIHWQRGEREESDPRFRGKDGAFKLDVRWPYPGHAIRIEADGYLPADSRVFSPDEGEVALEFKLEKGRPLTGVVRDAGGEAVAGAEVYLALPGSSLQVENGKVPAHVKRDLQTSTTAADGAFSFPPQRDEYRLVVLSDDGYAVLTPQQATASADVTLQPWAKIEGVAKIGTRPAGGAAVQSMANRDYNPKAPHLSLQATATTDADGRFVLDRVAPGPTQVFRVERHSQNQSVFVGHQNVDATAGQTAQVQLGGKGRPVVGRIALPPELKDTAWTAAQASISSKVDFPKLELPDEVQDMSAEERQAWYEQWKQTPEGKAYEEKQKAAVARMRHHPIKVEPDGSFRADDVEAGDYRLNVSLTAPPPANQCGFGEELARAKTEFTVDPIPGDVTDEPLELPTIPAEVTKVVKVGDVAPAFAAKTLDGEREVKLEDFRGKYVLLDFWATWCGPCLEETPALKAVHDALGNDDRFVMVGLSLDEKPSPPAKYTQKNAMGWHQLHLGEWSGTKVPESYGVRGIPSIWLIGPDGKVVAKDLRGPEIRRAVEQALSSR